jgi:hypothetical protein
MLIKKGNLAEFCIFHFITRHLFVIFPGTSVTKQQRITYNRERINFTAVIVHKIMYVVAARGVVLPLLRMSIEHACPVCSFTSASLAEAQYTIRTIPRNKGAGRAIGKIPIRYRETQNTKYVKLM